MTDVNPLQYMVRFYDLKFHLQSNFFAAVACDKLDI